jgi:hypothetical protein
VAARCAQYRAGVAVLAAAKLFLLSLRRTSGSRLPGKAATTVVVGLSETGRHIVDTATPANAWSPST